MALTRFQQSAWSMLQLQIGVGKCQRGGTHRQITILLMHSPNLQATALLAMKRPHRLQGKRVRGDNLIVRDAGSWPTQAPALPTVERFNPA